MSNIIEMPANHKEFDDTSLALLQTRVRTQRFINLLLWIGVLAAFACLPAVVVGVWTWAL